MISDYLQKAIRCPVCLASESTRGQAERQILDRNGASFRCASCKREYPALAADGYVDLRPPEGTFQDLTEYAEEAFHHRPGSIRPLFLSARVKMNMMRRMLRPSVDETLIDIGCGQARFLYFQSEHASQRVGIDAGAHFGAEPLRSVDLARGDIRQLPFASETFDKAYSLDVLEHLDEQGVSQMLSEARRVLKPGGELFLYSHVMMSSKLAGFQRAVNRLVRFFDRHGLLDNEPERHRKSDHRNVLRSYEQLDRVLAETGFEIAGIRYYNVFFKAVIEDLLLPLVEHNFFRRERPTRETEAAATGGNGSPAPHEHDDHDHHHQSLRPDVGRWAHAPLLFASYLLELDVLLFSRVRTGPFFLLLKRTGAG